MGCKVTENRDFERKWLEVEISREKCSEIEIRDFQRKVVRSRDL